MAGLKSYLSGGGTSSTGLQNKTVSAVNLIAGLNDITHGATGRVRNIEILRDNGAGKSVTFTNWYIKSGTQITITMAAPVNNVAINIFYTST